MCGRPQIYLVKYFSIYPHNTYNCCFYILPIILTIVAHPYNRIYIRKIYTVCYHYNADGGFFAALPIPQPLLSLGIGWVGLTSVEG